MRLAWVLPLFAVLSLQPAHAQVAQQENHTYDELGRLTSTTNTGTSLNGETRSICYDEAGNRVDFDVRTNGATTTCALPGSQTPPAAPPEPTEDPLPDPPANYAPTTVADSALGNCGNSETTDVVINDNDAENDALTLISIVPQSGDPTGQASITNSSGEVLVTFPTTASQSRTFIYTIQDTANNQAQGILWVQSDDQCTPLQ